MHNNEDILQACGTTWAGNGSDQLPTPTLFVHPGSNYMLSATGVLNSSTSLELSWGRAANSLNYQLLQKQLFRSAAGVTGLPLLFPDVVQADYVPWFQFNGGRTSNVGQYQTDRGPFTNENITHDVIANLTKVWGGHSSKMGFYFQHSFKPQSIFASFNSRSISTQRRQPVRHRVQLRQRHRSVQQLRRRTNALPEYLQEHQYCPGQLEAQPAPDARLRCAVLCPHAAVGHNAASVELHRIG